MKTGYGDSLLNPHFRISGPLAQNTAVSKRSP